MKTWAGGGGEGGPEVPTQRMDHGLNDRVAGAVLPAETRDVTVRTMITRALTLWVRFEVFTAETMKHAAFCKVTPCGSCKNRRFGGT
jgi:hypothetical protein